MYEKNNYTALQQLPSCLSLASWCWVAADNSAIGNDSVPTSNNAVTANSTLATT